MPDPLNQQNIYTLRGRQGANQPANTIIQNIGQIGRSTSRTGTVFNDLSSGTTSISNGSFGNGTTANRNSSRLLKFFDTNKDGKVSDDEAISYILNSRSKSIQTSRAVYSLNENARDFDEVAKAFDTKINDGRFTDEEVSKALLDLKTEKYKNINYENAVKILKSNANFDQLNSIVKLIDKNSNGQISDVEVLDTLLASRQGLIDINHTEVQRILRTNSNYEKISNFLQNINGNFNGEVSDQTVFEVLMSIRAGSVNENQAFMSMFLSKNPNRDKIANSIEVLDTDPNGQVSNSEFAKFILNARNGTINTKEHENVLAIIENNSSFKNLLEVINHVDSDKSGIISDEEIISFSLAVKKGILNLDQDLSKLVMENNQNLKTISEILAKVDKDNNGDVSNNEVLQALIAFRKGEITEQNLGLLNKLLSTNPNLEKIKLAISVIDSNSDGLVGDQELIEAELLFRQNKVGDIDIASWNTVINSNSNAEHLINALNLFDVNKNGKPSKINFTNKILDYRSGLVPNINHDIFMTAVETLDKEIKLLNSIDVFDSDMNGIIDDKSLAKGVLAARAGQISKDIDFLSTISSKNTNSQIINEAINILDTDQNGVVNAEEFTKNFIASVSVNGSVDFNRMSIISNILDVIYPDAQKLDQFRDAIDTNNDNQLSDIELIDGLLGLRNGTIENPGLDIIRVVISGNPNYQNIIKVIEKIDTDNNGTISNTNAVEGLLNVRKGLFSNEELPFAQAVLMKNSNHEELQNLVNSFDPDLNGTISNLELMDAMFKIRRGEIDSNKYPDIIEYLKNQNQKKKDIEQLVNYVDPNNSGTVDYNELVKGLLALSAGNVTRPDDELLVNLPNNTGNDYGESILRAETLVKQIDQNKNGEFGDNEIASLILANKANGILNTFSADFANAVFSTNPKSTEIKNLIDNIDKNNDGFFSDSEVINSILDYRKGNITISSESLFEMVLSNHPEYSKFKNIISRVDTDANGDISNQNLVEALFKFKDSNLSSKYKAQGENKLDQRSLEILDQILNHNSSKSNLETSYNLLATSSSGDLMRMKNTLLELKFGENNLTQFSNLISPADTIINEWDTQVKAAYSAQVTELVQFINSQTTNKDLDSLGLNTLIEFTTSLNKIKNDLVNGKKSSFNGLHDLFDNYKNSTSSLPQKTPSLISSIFYEDFKANLNTVKTFLDTGVLNNYDSKFEELARLSQVFDKDGDGKFNNQEVMNGILDISFKKVTISDPKLLNLVFASNKDFDLIKNFISSSDIDKNQEISKSELLNLYNSITQANNDTNKNLLALMGQYPDLASSYRTIKAFDVYGKADYSDSAILQGLLYMQANSNLSFDQETINAVFDLNPDSVGIQKIVNIIDPDSDGKYNNITDVLDHVIAIWQGKISSNNLAYDFNGDGVVNGADASTLFNLHMNINSLNNFQISR